MVSGKARTRRLHTNQLGRADKGQGLRQGVHHNQNERWDSTALVGMGGDSV